MPGKRFLTSVKRPDISDSSVLYSMFYLEYRRKSPTHIYAGAFYRSYDALFPFSHFTSTDDENIRIFFRAAGFLALAGRLAPQRFCTAQTATLFAFASTVRVIDRVHRGATHRRAYTHPARAARFA